MAYYYRGHLLKESGEYAAALADYRESVRLTPDNPFAHLAVAGLLATCKDECLRDGPQAVAHARKACELTEWKHVPALRSLATAYALIEDLPEAIRCCEKALEYAATDKDRRAAQQQLTFYRNRQAALKKGPPPP
jgi:tetratricopeptide (TPR) repeat protein